MSYREELLNSIEPNFIFSDKPLNRFKIPKSENNQNKLDKNTKILELKKHINSIQNCNLKDNAKKLIFGDGNINSPIMIVGEAPGIEEEKTEKTFQGESGALLEKMLKAINIEKNSIPPKDKSSCSEAMTSSIFANASLLTLDCVPNDMAK